jgi:hypothetical protein
LKSIWEHRDRRLWKIATGIFLVGLACVIVNALVFSNIGLYYLVLFLFFIGVVVWFARLGSDHAPQSNRKTGESHVP